MSSVVSKNLYELLGNDPELDPDREPEPPTKVVDKPTARTGKRNGLAEQPARVEAPAAGRSARRDNFTGSEQAFRDKTAGASNNRSKPTDDGVRQDRHPNRTREPNEHRDIGNRGRSSRGGGGYGARGMRGTRTGRDDRHSRTNIGEHEKQAAKGWGDNTGEGEFADEKGGLADAAAEEKAEGVIADDVPVDENGVSADQLAAEEDKTKSYEQYLAEQLEKRAALNDRPLAARQANEGSSKKFPEGKAFARDDTAENFIVGGGGKQARQRERKTKATLDIDQAWIEQEQSRGGDRGDRAPRGGRGGRGRGEGRGGRGEGRGRGRGGRGGPAGGDSQPRAGGRPSGQTPNITNASDFPSLGA